jgi:DnaJ family protein A protein 2
MTFKSVSQAYEILYDDQKREVYDEHGMAPFENGRDGNGSEVNFEDVLSHMFGGMGGMRGPGMPPGFGGAPQKPRKGKNEEQKYDVTLEELYRGKTVKFASTKNVVCSLCKGTGGKENVQPKQCTTCQGRGT